MQRTQTVVAIGVAVSIAAGAAATVRLPAFMPSGVPVLAAQTAAAAPQPIADRAPDAIVRGTWRTRSLVGDEALTNWKLAVRPGGLSFLDAVLRADAANVPFVEGASTQPAGGGIAKPLAPGLTPDEIAAIRARMGTITLLTYRADPLPPDAAARRAVFEFARGLGATTILVSATTPLDGLDTLAQEQGLVVAVLSETARPTALMKTLAAKGPALGIGLDTGLLAQEGVAPAEAVTLLKARLKYVNLRDRSGAGAAARNVTLGTGTAKIETLFDELNRQQVRPLAMTLDTTGILAAPADLFAAVDAFEAAVQPAYGRFFTAYAKTRPIRWDVVDPRDAKTMTPDQIAKAGDEIKARIAAALPKQAYAKPKKARTLLVIESLYGMSHDTIPLTNVMLERLGATTGAWTAEFSNDLDNLKYPKIKDYDGIFLNSIVGEAFAEPAVRDGLTRYLKEGGGVGGIHGTPWASRNWDEFAAIIGAQDAPHRIEQGVMKVYDPKSPLVKPLGTGPMKFQEEYYRFRVDGSERLRWHDVRVLLTVDLDDPAIEPRPWPGYKRPDKIYPVSWIPSFGKGRVFYSSLGHMAHTFWEPGLVGHFFAGVQFLLGDLDADTTPNPPAAASASR